MDLFEENFIETCEEQGLGRGSIKFSHVLPLILLFLLILSYLLPIHY